MEKWETAFNLLFGIEVVVPIEIDLNIHRVLHYTSQGNEVITATGTKKGDLFLADVNNQLKSRNVTTNIKVELQFDELAPALKAIFGFRVPDQTSGKIELQYLHECARISSSIGLTANPIVNFSGMLGTNVLTLGTDISFNIKTGNFTKHNAGLSFTNVDRITSLALYVGDLVNASYYHIVNPSTNIVVGVEASALIQHEWRPKSLFTISRKVDTKSIDKSPKNLVTGIGIKSNIGLACKTRPWKAFITGGEIA
ncbi:hypothetical protein GOBAR_AA25202 [Gossypium barbadense]|uniref:Uncharacterized protein n=1 Tax=Gossypium barbadense TaxID=3634 RepID=A0A2P5WWM9_GOSBA|nr:hypothetical protein GOBAR_AA25202 [Gossypium barbadense]